MENKETPTNQLDPQPKCDRKSIPTMLEFIHKQEEPGGGGGEEEDVLEMHGVPVPPVTSLPVSVSDVTPVRPFRRPHRGRSSSSKRKRDNPNIEKQQAMLKKLQFLMETLKPVPFIPPKILYFSKHEKLLKKIGLWDFVHIDFDTNVRVDLIAQLVATYDSKLRCCYVNKFRIAANRTNLARALKLPVKRVKGNVGGVNGVDLGSEVLAEEETEFIEEILYDWVILHGDMWSIPNEVLSWVGRIKDGHPEDVDWAGLFWFMVEKELTQGEQLIDCYYASHLQYLIKSQHEEVFVLRDAVAKEEEEDRNNEVDVKVGGITEVREVMEGRSMELTLGENVGNKEEEVNNIEMMDAGECKDEDVEEQRQWLLDGKKNVGEHYMKSSSVEEGRRCSLIDDEKETIEKAAEDVFNINVLSDDDALEGDGLTGNLLQAMVGNHLDFSAQGQFCEPSHEEVFVSRDVVAKEEEEDRNNEVDVKVGGITEVREVMEGRSMELTLGENVGNKEEEVNNIEMMDAGECKDKDVEEQRRWLLDGKKNVGEHYMKSTSVEEGWRCSLIDDEKETIEKAAEDVFNINFLSDDDAHEGDGLTGNLLQAMVGNHLDFSAQGQLCEPSPVDLNSDVLDLASVPSFSNNAGKRFMVQDNDISQHSLEDNKNKRLMINNSWDHKPVSFGMCMEKMQQSAERFNLMYKEKEKTLQQLDRNQQILLNELQERDMMIKHLQKTKLEEIRTRDGELYRLQRELHLMSSILDGYKKAMKETQEAFAEYRKKSQLPEEPYYIDAGFGGLMLSATEIEKLHKKQEEEYTLNCLILEQKAKEAEENCAGRFEAYLEKVNLLDKKLTGIETVTKELTESYAKQKMKKKLLHS